MTAVCQCSWMNQRQQSSPRDSGNE